MSASVKFIEIFCYCMFILEELRDRIVSMLFIRSSFTLEENLQYLCLVNNGV